MCTVLYINWLTSVISGTTKLQTQAANSFFFWGGGGNRGHDIAARFLDRKKISLLQNRMAKLSSECSAATFARIPLGDFAFSEFNFERVLEVFCFNYMFVLTFCFCLSLYWKNAIFRLYYPLYNVHVIVWRIYDAKLWLYTFPKWSLGRIFWQTNNT